MRAAVVSVITYGDTFTILTGLMETLSLVCPRRKAGSSSTISISMSSSAKNHFIENPLRVRIQHG